MADVRGISKILAAAVLLATPMVAHYEGMIPHTYADPVGIPTICTGHTGPDVVPGRVATETECRQILTDDLLKAADDVAYCVGPQLKVNEYAALISFDFNVGRNALCTSTMAKQINRGEPATVWCAQMDRWVYAKRLGIFFKLPGLVKRRSAERAMCEGNVLAGAFP